MLEDNRKLKLTKSFYLHGLDPEKDLAWLFNVSSGDVYDLTPHAFFIANSLDGKTRLGDIAKKFVNSYPEENSKEIVSDFENFIQTLESMGAVEDLPAQAGKEDK